MKLAEVILNYNVFWENRAVGARIPEIDSLTAGKIAVLIEHHAPRMRSFLTNPALPDPTDRDAVLFFASVMGQESAFSPSAFNLNLKAPRDVGLITRSILGIGPWPPAIDQGDYGCAMFKARYAKARVEFKGFTLEQVVGYLMDYTWAIPAMAKSYLTLLDGARRKYPTWDPRDAAAGLYNGGGAGFAYAVANPDSAEAKRILKHITSVRELRQRFDDELDASISGLS